MKILDSTINIVYSCPPDTASFIFATCVFITTGEVFSNPMSASSSEGDSPSVGNQSLYSHSIEMPILDSQCTIKRTENKENQMLLDRSLTEQRGIGRGSTLLRLLQCQHNKPPSAEYREPETVALEDQALDKTSEPPTSELV